MLPLLFAVTGGALATLSRQRPGYPLLAIRGFGAPSRTAVQTAFLPQLFTDFIINHGFARANGHSTCQGRK